MKKKERFTEGAVVKLECTIKRGMHPRERYIEVEIPEGIKILGFANERSLEDTEPTNEAPHKGFIHVVVAYKSSAGIGLLFPGELTSSTNPVAIPPDSLAAVAA